MTGTALRMATNFGHSPGIRFNLVVNYFVFRALTDRPLTVYGDGSNWRPSSMSGTLPVPTRRRRAIPIPGRTSVQRRVDGRDTDLGDRRHRR